MFAALLPPLVLVVGSCVTAVTSTSTSQTATDVTTSSAKNTLTSTEIMTASTVVTIVRTDETTSSTQTTHLTGVTSTLTEATTASTENMTTSSDTTATSTNKTTTSTDETNMTNSTNLTTSALVSTTAFTAYTDGTISTTRTDMTTPTANFDTTAQNTNNTFPTTHTGSTTPSIHANNTSATTTYTGSTNPVTPTGNASAPHTDTTAPVTHNDSNTNEPAAPTTTSTMSTVTSHSSVVTEPETPAPSTGKPSGGTTISASSQSDETLTSAQRTGIIIFVCMVVLIALITLGVIIITWRRRYKATISQAIDLRSIVNHRPNNARISLHEAVLDDDSLAETDVTTVGKPRADDGSEDNPKDTNPSPIMRNKSFPTTAFANPTYSFDVIDKRRPFSTFEGDVSQDSRSSSTYAKGNNSRVRHSSADDILSKSLKKSRLSMTSVASLAQSLSLCGLEYFTHEEEVDKMSFAGAMECDPSIGESNGEVAESEGGVNGYAENYEGQNATFYMQ